MVDDIRLSVPGDEPELKRVWKAVFGDSDEYIDGYFDSLYSPGSAVVCEIGGRMAGAAHIIELGDLVTPEGDRQPCSVVYALGTLPEFRSRGVGTRLTAAAAEISSRGRVGVICPAEPSLFDFYRKKAGYCEYFNVSEFSSTDPGVSVWGSAARTDAAGYQELRRSLLAERAYIDLSHRAMAYQERLCLVSGGGLFALTCGGRPGAAAVEVHGDRAVIKELLFSGPLSVDPALLVCRALGVSRYSYRAPVQPGGEGAHFAMIRNVPDEDIPDAGLAWFGFAFD